MNNKTTPDNQSKNGTASTEQLTRQLIHWEPAMRKQAAEELALRSDTEAVPPLVEALSDPDDFVRRDVVIALGHLGDVRAVEPLIDRLHTDTDPIVRRRAAIALGSIGDKRAIEPLIVALRDVQSRVPGYAALSLDWLGERWVQPFHERLREPDRDIRSRIMLALVQFQYYEERPFGALVCALRDEDRGVRSQAIRGLAGIGGSTVVEPLLYALDNDTHKSNRLTAIEPLVELMDKRALQSFIRALDDESDWVYENAARGLAWLDDAQAVGPLINVIKAGNLSRRSAAAWALGHMKEPAFTELLRLRNDPNRDIRWQAYSALSYQGKKAFEPMVGALKDPDRAVRHAAIRWLAEIDPGRVIEPEISALSDPESRARWVAARRLGQIRDEQVVPVPKQVEEADAGEVGWRTYARKVSNFAADASFMVRRRSNPNLVRVDGIEYDLEDGKPTPEQNRE
jgi:HEAT repeat protein